MRMEPVYSRAQKEKKILFIWVLLPLLLQSDDVFVPLLFSIHCANDEEHYNLFLQDFLILSDKHLSDNTRIVHFLCHFNNIYYVSRPAWFHIHSRVDHHHLFPTWIDGLLSTSTYFILLLFDRSLCIVEWPPLPVRAYFVVQIKIKTNYSEFELVCHIIRCAAYNTMHQKQKLKFLK